jgi:hypothetical protein
MAFCIGMATALPSSDLEVLLHIIAVKSPQVIGCVSMELQSSFLETIFISILMIIRTISKMLSCIFRFNVGGRLRRLH